jgi:hypothetical protein
VRKMCLASWPSSPTRGAHPHPAFDPTGPPGHDPTCRGGRRLPVGEFEHRGKTVFVVAGRADAESGDPRPSAASRMTVATTSPSTPRNIPTGGVGSPAAAPCSASGPAEKSDGCA